MASDTVQKIKERLSILDVIAPYVELQKAGKNYKGKSPFTNERTPSFYVSPDRGMYYCFSSSQGGDMFTFVEAMEGVDFKGALKILAEKAGVELVPEDPKKRSERDRLYELVEAAVRFFEAQLAASTEVASYLKDRAVTAKTIAAWRIGYAPGPPAHGWRELRDHLSSKGFTDADMQKAGVIKSADAGKAPYDVFRDRVMFPIYDPSGRPVGFSGRIFAKDSDAPKYVNSPETELFNKSEILFGYDKAKHGIRKFDFSLIVEGQFDVVLSHQAGYTNAVAVSGTALTPHHASLLQRLSNRVVLALDADRAGIAAVKRAADLMLARGMDVKVARLTGGKDPADLVREDPKLLKEAIARATHVIEFLLAILKEEARDERTYKLRARDEIVPYLLRIESRIDREHFEGVIAESLGTTAEAVRLEAARLERSNARAVPQQPEAERTEAKREQGESRADALHHYFAAVATILEPRERQTLGTAFARATGTTIEEIAKQTPPSVLSPLTFRLEGELAEARRDHVYIELASRLQELRELLIRASMREKRELLSAAERTGDDAQIEELTLSIAELQRALSAPAVSPAIFTE